MNIKKSVNRSEDLHKLKGSELQSEKAKIQKFNHRRQVVHVDQRGQRR